VLGRHGRAGPGLINPALRETRGARLVELVLVAGLLGGAAAARADPFATCLEQFASRPDDYASSYCFFQVAQREKRWGEAARLLDGLRAGHPDNGWLTLARGNVEWTRDVGRAETFYREAAARFAEQGRAEGEVLARTNLRTMLYRKGRLPEAGREVERALEVAERSGQDLVLARALVLEAQHLTDSGGDLGRACRSLRRAERAAFPSGPYTLRRSIVFGLGNASFQLGRLDDALDYYRRADAMSAEAQDRLTRAAARYNVVNTLFRQIEELPRPGGRDELLAGSREALATAEEADNREVQAMVHRTLGELLSARADTRAEGRAHYERCVAIASAIGQPRELAHCLWSLATSEAEAGRTREARRRIDEALALARETGHVWSLAHASRQRMRVAWATRSREEATLESLQSLDALESFRRLQDDEQGSAEAFSAWASDYHWLAGRLLAGSGGAPARGDLERAFAVVERMRARVLLDALGAGKAGSALPADHPLVARRREVVREVAQVHRDLLDPGVSAAARAELESRLEALEAEEEENRSALRALRPAAAEYDPARFATLSEVEAALELREALLSFQVGLDRDFMGEPAGGASVTVVTKTGTTVHPIPDRVRLHAVVPVFLGLFARRDEREAPAAAVLFRELLGSALSDLPPDVDRLVVVPDDVLHRVPFAALRRAADAEPLGARFETAIAPSATLWLRWRRSTRPERRGVLVLADPAFAPGRAGPTRSDAERQWSLLSEEELPALAHAREEGRMVARRLAQTTLWVGNEAAENALKQAPLEQFGLLHFAAHAVVDAERPERSAVLLAPGGEGEDGLLQSREIADLGLEGRVVVLSACRTAGGSLLRGEGVLSLARAFFQAGAAAVVASLWPLRDDEAAALVGDFYDELARGRSVGAALRGAQRAAIAAGRPAAAWAGLVAMGDDTRIPFPGGSRAWPSVALVAGAVLLVCALSLWGLRRRRRG
jgi:tetratricopeptide (TPR) repeat protein